MASLMLARESARTAKLTLFCIQAIDQPLTVTKHGSQQEFFMALLRIPSIQTTKRLPAAVLFHIGMRMRFLADGDGATGKVCHGTARAARDEVLRILVLPVTDL